MSLRPYSYVLAFEKYKPQGLFAEFYGILTSADSACKKWYKFTFNQIFQFCWQIFKVRKYVFLCEHQEIFLKIAHTDNQETRKRLFNKMLPCTLFIVVRDPFAQKRANLHYE